MKVYREYCRTVYDRKGKLIPEEDIAGKTGYCTVYGYDEEASILVEAQGNSKNLAAFKMYADQMLVDFDNQPDAAMKLKESLLNYELEFSMWDSGNRSYHFHIPHEPKWSKDLPYNHERVLCKLGDFNTKTPVYDPTIYRANSIFRLPNTVHVKTGKRKVLLESHEGYLLDFELEPTPERKKKIYRSTKPPESFEDLWYMFWYYHLCTPDEGNRHGTFFTIACECFDVGLKLDTAIDLLTLFNSELPTPKSESEVRRACIGGYEYKEEGTPFDGAMI